jgi:anti-sigma B factor antagonist
VVCGTTKGLDLVLPVIDADEGDVVPESLHIDAPSAPLALDLIERLNGFHAELVPVGGERFQVRVDLDGRAGADRLLLDSLDRVEGWLESSGLDLAEVRLDGRSYRLERKNGTPHALPVDSDLDGLVCRMRTIPLGTGVQVVSAEGELDLHTAPQLDEALRSTTCPRVILNLTDVPFLDSTALSVIVASEKRMRAEGRQLMVAAGNPATARVLSITGLDRALKIRPSLSEAIESALDGLVGDSAR